MIIHTTGKPDAPRNGGLVLSAVLAGTLALSACAATPQPPTSELLAAEQAIGAAEQSRAGRHASLELHEARDRLAGARSAIQQEDMERARRLAAESRVYAELASAKNAEAKALATNQQMRSGTEELEQEMQRNPGAAQ